MRVLLVAVLLATAPSADAQFGMLWRKTPTIVILSPEGDPRIALVDEAIEYWNRALEDAGSPFRLPAAGHATGPIPDDALRELSGAIVGRRFPLYVPQALRGLPGDITVILSQSHFISFAGPFDPEGRRVIGIRGTDAGPLSLPNVARNVIAHEFGHVIGLHHNSDATKLMCGRPAPCRPPDFESSRPHIFPLTDGERAALRRMYPPL